MSFCFEAAAEAEGRFWEPAASLPAVRHLCVFLLREGTLYGKIWISSSDVGFISKAVNSLGLHEICLIRLCSDGGWKSVSEDCNHSCESLLKPGTNPWRLPVQQAAFNGNPYHPARNLLSLEPFQEYSNFRVHCLFILSWSSDLQQCFKHRPPLHPDAAPVIWDDRYYRTGS